MSIELFADDTILVVEQSDPELIEVSSPGPQGPAGTSPANTVTANGGTLDVDKIVLGNGGTDTKTEAGFYYDSSSSSLFVPLDMFVGNNLNIAGQLNGKIIANLLEAPYLTANYLISYDGTYAADFPAGAGVITALSLDVGSVNGIPAGSGIASDGNSKLKLGVAGTSVGSIEFSNATSGTATMSPPTGALGTISYTLPAVTSTLATLGANAFTAGQAITGADNVSLLQASGATYLFRVLSSSGWGGAGFEALNTGLSAYVPFIQNGSSITFRIDGAIAAILANSGRLSIGSNTNPTANIHIKAGTATANTAPLKLTSGTNMTTAEAGAFEYNGTDLFFTRSGTTRETVLTTAASVTTTITGKLSVAKEMFFGQFTTGGAPTAVLGAAYFDTTLNKLRIGGAGPAWETVTSV